MTQTILSLDATLLDAEGYTAATGLPVALHTDSDGDTFIRINRTLHLLSDIVDEQLNAPSVTSERLHLLASNQTIIL